MRNMILFLIFWIISLSRIYSSVYNDDLYWNPVVNYSLPDPSVIKGNDGYFYLNATEDIRNLPIHCSKDLVNWEFVETVFTNQTRPNFVNNGGSWAPDIYKIDDRYILYYPMSVWGLYSYI